MQLLGGRHLPDRYAAVFPPPQYQRASELQVVNQPMNWLFVIGSCPCFPGPGFFEKEQSKGSAPPVPDLPVNNNPQRSLLLNDNHELFDPPFIFANAS